MRQRHRRLSGWHDRGHLLGVQAAERLGVGVALLNHRNNRRMIDERRRVDLDSIDSADVLNAVETTPSVMQAKADLNAASASLRGISVQSSFGEGSTVLAMT